MHGMFGQPPPMNSFSTTAVFMPSCAARIAATYPPGPPPTITMSKDVSAKGSLLLSWVPPLTLPLRCSGPLPLPPKRERGAFQPLAREVGEGGTHGEAMGG